VRPAFMSTIMIKVTVQVNPPSHGRSGHFHNTLFVLYGESPLEYTGVGGGVKMTLPSMTK
jgi:hypothetical protein